MCLPGSELDGRKTGPNRRVCFRLFRARCDTPAASAGRSRPMARCERYRKGYKVLRPFAMPVFVAALRTRCDSRLNRAATQTPRDARSEVLPRERSAPYPKLG